jgi:hypothetical protein
MHPLWVAELQKEILCLCASHFDLLHVIVQVYSCLEFDLTLGLIPRVYVTSSCSRYFSKLYIILLANSKLIGT